MTKEQLAEIAAEYGFKSMAGDLKKHLDRIRYIIEQAHMSNHPANEHTA